MRLHGLDLVDGRTEGALDPVSYVHAQQCCSRCTTLRRLAAGTLRAHGVFGFATVSTLVVLLVNIVRGSC